MEQSTLDILPEEMSITSDISDIESDNNSWTIITSGSIRGKSILECPLGYSYTIKRINKHNTGSPIII